VRPVLIDGRPLQGDSATRGIGTYLRGLLGGMAEIGVDGRIALLLSRGAPPPTALSSLGLEAVPEVARLERRAQVLADPWLVASALRRRPPLIYHAVEYGQPRRARVPVVVTVHDLIPFLLPGYSWRSRLLRRSGLHLLRRADAVITPSRATAADCARIGGVDPGRIHVIPHGLSTEFRPAPAEVVDGLRRRLRLTRPYLLGVGTFEPRKGLRHLVEVTRRLRAAHGLDLVIAGSQGLFAARVGAELAALGDHAHDLGFVSDGDLVALMSGAAAFVFPTAYEGFGLPLLEAMGCGTIAAGFANSSLPEVAGDAAILVADGDTGELAAALDRVLSDPEEAAARRARGAAHAAGFTWAEAARRTVAVYEQTLGGPLPG